jgi:predicted dienelactone hydrolase
MRLIPCSHAVAGAAAFLFLTLAGCGSDSGTTTTPPTANPDELFELGSFEVGYREIPITYDDAGTMNEREVILRVWYPAQDGSGAPLARYAVGGIVDIPTDVALDAPPVTDATNLPLAIYSHGNGGEGLLGYPYGELMASHGWILVAPNHTGNTAFDFLDNPDPFTRSALDRPNDITAIIDELESGFAGDELEGRANTSAVFLFGHSFGGYTTFVTGGTAVDVDALIMGCDGAMSDDCDVLAAPGVEAAYRAGFLDERVVALAPQAPAIGSIVESELAELDVPSMLMSGLLDQTTTQEESAEPAWRGLDHPDDIWVEMPRGAHFTFITICHDLTPDLLELFRPDAGQDGCGEQFIDTQEAIPVLAAYVFAFGRRHVLGQTEWDAVLEGPALGNEGDFIIRTK